MLRSSDGFVVDFGWSACANCVDAFHGSADGVAVSVDGYIEFDAAGEEISARVERMGIRYLAARATRVEELGPREAIEFGYCFKVAPSCAPGNGFDQDPQLVRLEWRHDYERVWRLVGELELRDSPFDPVADLPVRRIVELEYTEGTTQSSGRVLRPVPGDWLVPFLHQRYDDPAVEGIEV